MKDRLRRILLGLYAVVCLLAVAWPGFDLVGNRVEPYVLGLPFVLAWNVGWVTLTFLVMLVYHLSGRDEG